jgi:hypothetical protein
MNLTAMIGGSDTSCLVQLLVQHELREHLESILHLCAKGSRELDVLGEQFLELDNGTDIFERGVGFDAVYRLGEPPEVTPAAPVLLKCFAPSSSKNLACSSRTKVARGVLMT